MSTEPDPAAVSADDGDGQWPVTASIAILGYD